ETSTPGLTFLRPSALALNPQFWILPQPKYSNLRRNPVWFNLQLTAQYQLCQTSEPCEPSTNCSPKTHQASSTPTSVHQTNCASSSTSITCQNKLVKLFSCLLSVILHVGQI
ncbi:hypothetical protein ILYODFUR_028196, partial [Ilyodon furcidens]